MTVYRIDNLFRILLLTIVSFLTACEPYHPDDNPILRNLTWSRYVAGDDIRHQCMAGAPDRWRFVYNGIYDEQVRTYDIERYPGPNGDGVITARVKGRGEVAEFLPFEPFGPWRGKIAQGYISAAALADMDQAAMSVGLDRITKPGTRLRSDNFYWVATACRNGVFFVHAWQQPQDTLAALGFSVILLGHDHTGIPYNAPRQLSLGPFGNSYVDRGELTSHFQFVILKDGTIY